MSFSPKNSYNKEEILDCAQGNLFGQENGRLPTPNMLMFDRIITINNDGGKYSKGESVTAGSIIVRQRGTKFHPGKNVGLGKDHTLFSKIDGKVSFVKKGPKLRQFVNVEPA